MKRLLSIFLSVVCIMMLGACGGVQLNFGHNSQSQLKHEGNSTVALVLYVDNVDADDSNVKVYCSAVWVGAKDILTADHCVKAIQERAQKKEDAKEKEECDAATALLGTCEGFVMHKEIELIGLPIHFVQWNEVDDVGKETTAWHLAKVVKTDESHDLAMIECQDKELVHETAKVATKTPELSEHVVAIGHPSGFYYSVLNGTVAAYRGSIKGYDVRGPFLQLQAPVFYGNSGGPLYNDNAELVGIADAITEALPSEGFYIHLDTIRHFLYEK